MHFCCLLLAKIVSIYALSVCKISPQKIWSCKFFDKFQVCGFDAFCGSLIFNMGLSIHNLIRDGGTTKYYVKLKGPYSFQVVI